MNIVRAASAASLGAVALLVVSCSSPEPVTAPEVPAAGASSSPTSSPAPTENAGNESVRGNLVKSVGESFGFWTDATAPEAKFVVTGIEIDPTCTGPYAQPSENGHFVKVTLEGETSAELPGSVFFGLGAWSLIAENGTTFNGDPSTSPAYSCLRETEVFPDVVGPGERVAGAVVLDVPTATGVLILKDSAFDSGWEWSYPQ